MVPLPEGVCYLDTNSHVASRSQLFIAIALDLAAAAVAGPKEANAAAENFGVRYDL